VVVALHILNNFYEYVCFVPYHTIQLHNVYKIENVDMDIVGYDTSGSVGILQRKMRKVYTETPVSTVADWKAEIMLLAITEPLAPLNLKEIGAVNWVVGLNEYKFQ